MLSKLLGMMGKPGGGRRKLERDHGSVVLVIAARLRVNMRNLRSQLSLN